MLDLTDQRILITGGRGFLGRALRRALLAQGVPPVSILTPSRADFDLTDPHAVRRLYAASFPGSGPSLVLNCAGFVGGLGANRMHPANFFHDNLAIPLHLVEHARLAGLLDRPFKFVQIGTMCSYPANAPIPYREDSLWTGLPDPEIASYGVSKLASLQLLEAYRLQHGLKSAYVIPTGFFGPGDNTNPANSHVVGALVRKYVHAAQDNAPSVTNWGSGAPTRDFIFIDDAAQGTLRAAQLLDTPTPINLTGGTEVSIRHLAELIARLADYRGQTIWDTSKGDGQPRRALDGSRARQLLNWSPATPLEVGIRQTVDWFRALPR
jgi:GDP-L-fucose synthase